jgi:hypothetical protein
VDDQHQLNRFLAEHPVHQLAGGENAFKLEDYLHALTAANFDVRRVIGPRDSVINAFPNARNHSDLKDLPQLLLRKRFGSYADLFRRIHFVRSMIWFYLKRRRNPGRMYSFLSIKPDE